MYGICETIARSFKENVLHNRISVNRFSSHGTLCALSSRDRFVVCNVEKESSQEISWELPLEGDESAAMDNEETWSEDENWASSPARGAAFSEDEKLLALIKGERISLYEINTRELLQSCQIGSRFDKVRDEHDYLSFSEDNTTICAK